MLNQKSPESFIDDSGLFSFQPLFSPQTTLNNFLYKLQNSLPFLVLIPFNMEGIGGENVKQMIYLLNAK